MAPALVGREPDSRDSQVLQYAPRESARTDLERGVRE